MISIRDGGGIVQLASIRVRDGGGLSDLSQVYVRDGSGLHAIFNQMFVAVSPTFVTGSVYSAAAPRATTNAASASVTGGQPPYTVEWAFDDPDWEAINPTALTTAFRSPHLFAGSAESTLITCTITDATGAIASMSISASATNEYAGP